MKLSRILLDTLARKGFSTAQRARLCSRADFYRDDIMSAVRGQEQQGSFERIRWVTVDLGPDKYEASAKCR